MLAFLYAIHLLNPCATNLGLRGEANLPLAYYTDLKKVAFVAR
ncbi:hypothetical protein GPAL_1006 [Glaciecola pallidula DSM 14239 = ACAM 615]|uniref:Uncharacterized protein n=1 Tax=Brumicola pallidula DSM 14239 = ACAM 615 TaxID=1121922 RepID=K6ZX32_9ALTE|nr:hypothetical protein GPAL_1006 [Glaciecola pallidula DSM 14239 = ACAM 615]